MALSTRALRNHSKPMPQLRQCELVEPGRFRWGDATVPTPSEGEVLVRPGAVGMCGTDYHAFDGTQNFFTYPRILGHEVGATVVSFGPGCEDSGLKVGDRVAVVPYWECGSCVACRWGKPNCCTSIKVIGVHINGAMQGHLCVPKSKLVKSDILSLEQLALVETLCIGAHAVFRASVRTGERALVIGAGPIGLGTAQFAQAAGCEVIVMDVNEQRLDFMRATLGVEKAIVVRPGAPEVVLAELQEACEGELPTTVFDATGNLHSMNGAFSFVAHGGKLVFVGHTKMSISFDNPLFHSREMTVLASRNALAEDFARVIKLIETAKIDVSPWVTHRCAMLWVVLHALAAVSMMDVKADIMLSGSRHSQVHAGFVRSELQVVEAGKLWCHQGHGAALRALRGGRDHWRHATGPANACSLQRWWARGPVRHGRVS